MNKPKDNFSMALIDADIVAYRCSISAQDEHPTVCESRIDDLMDYCLEQTVGFSTGDNYKVFLTGRENFRYYVAKSYDYKGNRKDKEKPTHLAGARQHLIDNWGAIVVDGAEADDAIAIEATKYGDASVMVSQDKDFNTVPGWKYNFVTNRWRYDTKETALEYFYTQVLTGDTADNIVGLYRVGPKTAEKVLDSWTDEKDLFDRCIKAYKESPTLVGDPYERVMENARLLHLQRYPEELWEAPDGS